MHECAALSIVSGCFEGILFADTSRSGLEVTGKALVRMKLLNFHHLHLQYHCVTESFLDKCTVVEMQRQGIGMCGGSLTPRLPISFLKFFSDTKDRSRL